MNKIKYNEIFIEALHNPLFLENSNELHTRNALIGTMNLYHELKTDINKDFLSALNHSNNFIDFSFTFQKLFRQNEDNISLNIIAWNLFNLRTQNIDRALKFIYFLYTNNNSVVTPLHKETPEDVIATYYGDFDEYPFFFAIINKKEV